MAYRAFSILKQFKMFCLCVVTLMGSASCVTQFDEDAPYGVTPNKTGYIPARMALASCITWPERATRISGMPLGNASRDETQKLCNEFDLYIAAGFENQPFMKGLSPKFVEKLYASSGMSPSISDAIAQQWQHSSEDCSSCRTPTAFYNGSIAHRKQWNVWLANFARATKGTDAILVPLILYNNTTKEDDRGLMVARRTASIALLLIDTANGELIWSGGREADVASKAFQEDPRAKNLAPPDQDELKKRLFTDALWLAFPGRQVYK